MSLCQYEAGPGPAPRGGKPFGLRTGGELRVCKPFGAGATVNQNPKWKFQLIRPNDGSRARHIGSQANFVLGVGARSAYYDRDKSG